MAKQAAHWTKINLFQIFFCTLLLNATPISRPYMDAVYQDRDNGRQRWISNCGRFVIIQATEMNMSMMEFV